MTATTSRLRRFAPSKSSRLRSWLASFAWLGAPAPWLAWWARELAGAPDVLSVLSSGVVGLIALALTPAALLGPIAAWVPMKEGELPDRAARTIAFSAMLAIALGWTVVLLG